MSATDLIAKARQFDQLDRKCVELSYGHGKPADEAFVEYFSELFELCARAYSLWNDIKLSLGEVDSLRIIDPDVRKTVRKIRENHDFLVIRQYLTIARCLNTGVDDVNEQYPTDFVDFVRERFDDLFRRVPFMVRHWHILPPKGSNWLYRRRSAHESDHRPILLRDS